MKNKYIFYLRTHYNMKKTYVISTHINLFIYYGNVSVLIKLCRSHIEPAPIIVFMV